MEKPLLVLIAEAIVVYLLVLGAHSLRGRVGLALLYALIGALTAVMSWVTDAFVTVDAFGLSFVVGSTVFYTSLLLGVFVVYVFDGPRATRVAILTVAGISAIVPLIALTLHAQTHLVGATPIRHVPLPSLRINVASVVTTIADLLFLAMAWESLGRARLRAPLWLRAYLTLLGVMVLDVVLFNTGAFLGTPRYLSILSGTLATRLVVSLFAFPFLYLYLAWQKRRVGISMPNRPVLAILKEFGELRAELGVAQQEIERRKEAEREKEKVIADLETALSEVRTLRAFLPICAHCKKIRDDDGYWKRLEAYLQSHSDIVFSHGICPDCLQDFYPEYRRSGAH